VSPGELVYNGLLVCTTTGVVMYPLLQSAHEYDILNSYINAKVNVLNTKQWEDLLKKLNYKIPDKYIKVYRGIRVIPKFKNKGIFRDDEKRKARENFKLGDTFSISFNKPQSWSTDFCVSEYYSSGYERYPGIIFFCYIRSR
jgi:hypothetical protein